MGLPEPLSGGGRLGLDVPQPKARAHWYVARATCAPGMPSPDPCMGHRPLQKAPSPKRNPGIADGIPARPESRCHRARSQKLHPPIPECRRAETPKLHAPIPECCGAIIPKTATPDSKCCTATKPKIAPADSGMVPCGNPKLARTDSGIRLCGNAKNDKPGFEILRCAKGKNRTYTVRNGALR